MIYIIYKLTRDDGKIYIGQCQKVRFKSRMNSHKVSDRFKNHTFKKEILCECTSYESALEHEETYITKYDSYNNGLNSTPSGNGHGHNSPNFNTIGYKFSEESRRKMSESAKKRGANCKGHKHTEETKKLWSEQRKGKAATPAKANYPSDYEWAFNHNSFRDKNNKIRPLGTKLPNGRRVSKVIIMCQVLAKKFDQVPNNFKSKCEQYINDFEQPISNKNTAWF